MSGPSLVRVRFYDVHQMMREASTGDKRSSVEVARLLTSTFPSCDAKRDTNGKKEMFYIGQERKPCESDRQPKPGTSATAQDIMVLPVEIQLSHERSLNQLLTTKVQRLEQQNQQLTEYIGWSVSCIPLDRPPCLHLHPHL